MRRQYFHPDTYRLPLTAQAIARWTSGGLEHLDHVAFALADLRERGWVDTQRSELLGQVWMLTARGLAETMRAGQDAGRPMIARSQHTGANQ